MPPKKKPAALSAKQEEEELSEMVTITIITINTIIDLRDHHHIKFKTIISEPGRLLARFSSVSITT